MFVLESLPEGERKTGKELYDDCLTVRLKLQKEIDVDYWPISNKDQLLEKLTDIFNEAEKGYIPIIHFETHGSDGQKGEELEFCFILSSGEKVPLSEIKEILTNINISTGNKLFISVAACFGAAIFTLTLPTERSPFWAIMGPDNDIYPEDIIAAFHEFYNKLIYNMDGNIALKSANQLLLSKGIKLQFITSEYLFKEAYKYFIKGIENQNIDNIINKLIRTKGNELVKKYGTKDAAIQQMYKKLTAEHEKEESFNKCRDYFFMFDLYPQKREELNLKYSDLKT